MKRRKRRNTGRHAKSTVLTHDRISISSGFSPFGKGGAQDGRDTAHALEAENRRLRGRIDELGDLAYAADGIPFRRLFVDLLRRHGKVLACATAFRDMSHAVCIQRCRKAFRRGIAVGVASAIAAVSLAASIAAIVANGF